MYMENETMVSIYFINIILALYVVSDNGLSSRKKINFSLEV